MFRQVSLRFEWKVNMTFGISQLWSGKQFKWSADMYNIQYVQK